MPEKEITSALVVIEENEAKNHLTEDEEFICRVFKELEIDKQVINIRKCPEAYKRLAETGDHFKDAYKMAKIIKVLLGKDEIKKKKEENHSSLTESEMLACTLMHDIGKSGPLGISNGGKKLIKILFPSTSVKGVIPSTTIEEYLATPEISSELKKINMDIETGKEMIEKFLGGLYVKNEHGEKTDKMETIINFFRRHADWTEEILAKIWKEQPFTKDVINIASCHHLLDGRDPYNDEFLDNACKDQSWELALYELIQFNRQLKEYNQLWIALLTLVDKYQAFRERSRMDHNPAIDILRKVIENNKTIKKEKKRAEYALYLDVLDKAKDEIEPILKKEYPKNLTIDNVRLKLEEIGIPYCQHNIDISKQI